MSERPTWLGRLMVAMTLLIPGAVFGLPDRLPENLVWVTNDEDPTFAAPEAKRGGTFRSSISSFPLTLRRVGPDSNGAFAGFLRYNQMGLVQWHPNTRHPIPSLASHWAFDADGKTVYYRIDKDARWSDGVPVTGQADPGGQMAGVIFRGPGAVLRRLDRRESEPLGAGRAMDVPV